MLDLHQNHIESNKRTSKRKKASFLTAEFVCPTWMERITSVANLFGDRHQPEKDQAQDDTNNEGSEEVSTDSDSEPSRKVLADLDQPLHNTTLVQRFGTISDVKDYGILQNQIERRFNAQASLLNLEVQKLSTDLNHKLIPDDTEELQEIKRAVRIISFRHFGF